MFSHSPEGLQKLLDAAYQWSLEWGIAFHPDKCSVIRFGPYSKDATFKLGNSTLEIVHKMTLLGMTFYSDKQPAREANDAANAILNRIPYILNGNVPVPTKFATHLWDAKISPIILYGSEIFPVGENEIKTQRKAARAIIGAPVNTNSIALFEFLGWLRVETLSDRRCLLFAERLRDSPHPIILEAFNTSCEEELPWFQRLSTLLDKYDLKEEWTSRKGNWKETVKKKVNEAERTFWRESLDIRGEDDTPFSVNHPGKGSSLIWNGFGLQAKAAFFFRYSYPAHYQRHTALQHFNQGCPLCGHEYGSPKHILFECDGNLCSSKHKGRFLQRVQTIRDIYEFSKCDEADGEERILALTGPLILDYNTATALQHTLISLHRMWCRYDSVRERQSAPAREVLYHAVQGKEQLRNLEDFYASADYSEKKEIADSWEKSARTKRRWLKAQSEEFQKDRRSVAKELEFYRKMDLAVRYTVLCDTKAERAQFLADEEMGLSTMQKHCKLARDNGFLPPLAPRRRGNN